jgi:hypothetical protein
VPAKASRLVDAGSHEETVQPGVEPIRVAERGQVAPSPDERVLHRVPGLFPIPVDEASGGIQAVDRGACQRGKGVMIAPLRPLHDVPLHIAPRGGAAGLAVLAEYGEAEASIVPISPPDRSARLPLPSPIPAHQPRSLPA